MKRFSYVTMKRTVIAAAAVCLTVVGPACKSDPPPAPVVVPTDSRTIFFDSFDGVKPEWQQFAGIWETISGWMIQRTDDPRQLNAIKYINTPRASDCVIETEVRVKPYRPSQWTNSAEDEDLRRGIRSIYGAGVVFRMKNKDNYYMFRLAGEEGAVLGKMVDGEWKDLENPRVRGILRGERIGFRDDNIYRLRVEAVGARIQCFIDDEPVCTHTDSSFDLGQIGLVTFKTGAEFDFIKVTRP
jgi:hypothetical protein